MDLHAWPWASLRSLGLGVDLTCVNLALLLAFIVHSVQWTWPCLPSHGIAHHCELRLRHPREPLSLVLTLLA